MLKLIISQLNKHERKKMLLITLNQHLILHQILLLIRQLHSSNSLYPQKYFINNNILPYKVFKIIYQSKSTDGTFL